MLKFKKTLPVILLLFLGSFVLISSRNPEIKPLENNNKIDNNHKIQVAILLDVSNSMDGLIDQAKAQLWNMVSVMGRAKCNGLAPRIEIALYEYGRDTNDKLKGYIKRINGFNQDLDELSQNLFKLTTNGGEEYCGHVLFSSLTELEWSNDAADYKVIFIAGNEDFLQGGVAFTKACNEAKKRGVIVNTIFCGDKIQGIREHWNLGNECGNGSFSNINSNAKMEELPTPYDDAIFSLNDKLNATYISYGYSGIENQEKQDRVDKLNYSSNKSAAVKRVTVKGNKDLYNNASWDLVDAARADNSFIDKVDMKTLPDSLKTKSRAELQHIVNVKIAERGIIQKEIEAANIKREAYLASEASHLNLYNHDPTLETEIEKIIKIQAKRFNMLIE